MKLVDTHCHIHDERIPGGPEAAVVAARSAGVTTMVTVGCDRATSLAAIQTAQQFPDVFATIGLHPHDAVNGVESIADLFTGPGADRVIAVGEAGLDYYYDHSPREIQQTVFAEQIALAHERDLPLVIHTRDAWDDTFDVLAAQGVPTQTIFHCFTGGPDEARRCLDIGAFISFSGIVTFKSASDVQAAAKLVPADRLLVETDSPYLAPVPHRGQPNQPAWVVDVVRFLADLRDQPFDAFAEATAETARLAFPRLNAPTSTGQTGTGPTGTGQTGVAG